MNNAELQATAEHYKKNLTQNLDDVTTVDWGSRASQEARFEVFAELYERYRPRSILDVGCGLGGFYQFLTARGHRPIYTGLDICEDMIAAMKSRYPEVEGITHNLLEEPLHGSWDFILCSGIFNRKGSADNSYTQAILHRLWECTENILAWNMLSTRADPRGIAPTTRLSNPETWHKFATTLGGETEMRHDYLPHDFTLFVRKARQ
jgi:SAM-dependent methyltransferase